MRGIDFLLTFEEFQEFDRATNYVARMGSGPDNLTIDRIDSRKGYEVGNIRALTYEDNVSKKLERLEFPSDPIAMALWERAGCPKNWRAFRKPAEEIYDLVVRLQKNNQPEETQQDDNCPF